jgi:hypothetical protein
MKPGQLAKKLSMPNEEWIRGHDDERRKHPMQLKASTSTRQDNGEMDGKAGRLACDFNVDITQVMSKA